jgi:hypothetical protein
MAGVLVVRRGCFVMGMRLPGTLGGVVLMALQGRANWEMMLWFAHAAHRFMMTTEPMPPETGSAKEGVAIDAEGG